MIQSIQKGLLTCEFIWIIPLCFSFTCLQKISFPRSISPQEQKFESPLYKVKRPKGVFLLSNTNINLSSYLCSRKLLIIWAGDPDPMYCPSSTSFHLMNHSSFSFSFFFKYVPMYWILWCIISSSFLRCFFFSFFPFLLPFLSYFSFSFVNM